MVVLLKSIFVVNYISKLGESWYHSFTGFVTDIIINIEYNEDMLLERMTVTPLETHKEFWGKTLRDHRWQTKMALLIEC